MSRFKKKLDLSNDEFQKLACILNEDRRSAETLEFVAEVTGKSITEVQQSQVFSLAFDKGHDVRKVRKALSGKVYFTERRESGKYMIEVWTPLDFMISYLIADSILWKQIRTNPFNGKHMKPLLEKNPVELKKEEEDDNDTD